MSGGHFGGLIHILGLVPKCKTGKGETTMKRLTALFALVLGLFASAAAQDQSKTMEMTGVVCDEKCVTHDSGQAACSTSCKEHSGQAVFLDNSGKLWKVSNPASCKGKMGKAVKVHGEMKDDDTMFIRDVILANAG
jgi:hypothetical protein